MIMSAIFSPDEEYIHTNSYFAIVGDGLVYESLDDYAIVPASNTACNHI